MSQDSPSPVMGRSFWGRFTFQIASHPRKTLAGAGVVLICCALLTVFGLNFKSDRSDLISPDAKFHKRWLEYCERFRETNELLILLESHSSQQLAEARDWITEQLKARHTLFANTMVHSSLEAWQNLSEASYADRTRILHEQLALAQTVQESGTAGSPMVLLLAASQEEILRNIQQQAHQATSLPANFQQLAAQSDSKELAMDALFEGPPSLDITSRIILSLEQSLHSIDNSYQQYFPRPVVSQNQIWSTYLSDRESAKISPKTSTSDFLSAAAPRRDAETEAAISGAVASAAAGTKNLHQELISVVPLPPPNPGPEKYGENIQVLGHLLDIARHRFPQTEFGLTGIPQLEHEEMARSQEDMALSSVVSFAGVILLLLFGFRGVMLPLACCITLCFGMVWTLGLTTLTIGHLNILSMAFAAILAGLGIDFCIHLLSSFQVYRQQGHSSLHALSLASDTVGKGIVTAAITTSVAFLCASLTDFPGVAELGLIAGFGVLLTVLAAFIIFPCLVVLFEQWGWLSSLDSLPVRLLPLTSAPQDSHQNTHRHNSKRPQEGAFTEPLRRLIASRPVWVLLLLACPLSLLIWQGWDWDQAGLNCRIPYDSNLLNMQPENLPAAETQNKLMAGREGEVLYAVTWYSNQAEAIAQAERFRQLPSVGRVMELASYRQEGMQQLPQDLPQFLQVAENIAPPPHQTIPLNPAQVGQILEQTLTQLQKTEGIVETQLRLQLDHFLDSYAQQPFDVQIHILEAVEQELVRSLWSEIRLRVASLKNDLEQQRQVGQILTARYVNDRGDWLVQIHPKFDVWDDAGLAEFVSEVRSVDPHVTGTPIQNYEASHQLKVSYLNAALYAALAIILIVLLDVTKLRTILRAWPIALLFVAGLVVSKWSFFNQTGPELTPLALIFAFVACVIILSLFLEREQCLIGLLALLPPTTGGLMMLGLMDVLNLQFNPANLIALPLVMGIGIDDGVHVIHDFHRTRKSYYMSASTWRALVLTTLTSIIGFGSLAIASHRGLSGLGWVVVIGITSCLFASVIVLPAVLAIVSRFQPRSGVESEELAADQSVKSLPLTSPISEPQPQTAALPVEIRPQQRAA